MGVLPVLAEAGAVCGLAMSSFNWPVLPSLMLGVMMAPVGSGHMLPTLTALKEKKLGPMPRNMFCSIPLEAVTALCTFGILQGFAQGSGKPVGAAIGLGIFFKVLGTIMFVSLIAFLFAQLADNRSDFKVAGKKMFTSTMNEEALLLISAVLITYVLCSDNPVIVNNGYSVAENIFQPELGVVVVSLMFSQLRPLSIHAIEDILSSVWMIGALFLFTSLGSNISIAAFSMAGTYLSFIAVGLLARLGMILLIAFFAPLNPKRTWFRREPLHRLKTVYEALFCWTATFHRATLQGALSKIPMAMSLFNNDTNHQIVNAGIFAMAFMAPIGALVFEFTGRSEYQEALVRYLYFVCECE
jgi:hypothetical protein